MSYHVKKDGNFGPVWHVVDDKGNVHRRMYHKHAADRIARMLQGEEGPEEALAEAAEPEEEPAPRPLSIDVGAEVSGTIRALRERLDAGDLDDYLDALEAAEKDGQARDGALAVIRRRRAAVAE